MLKALQTEQFLRMIVCAFRLQSYFKEIFSEGTLPTKVLSHTFKKHLFLSYTRCSCQEQQI